MPVTNGEIPYKDIKEEKISFEVLKYVPEESAVHYKFIPIGMRDSVLEIGIVDPEDIDTRDAISFITSRLNVPYKLFRISEEDFGELVQGYKGLSGQVTEALEAYGTKGEAEDKKKESVVIEELIPSSEIKGGKIIEEAPVTKIVGVIIQNAIEGHATDVHIEPLVERVRVRFRVDGVLYTSLFLPLEIHEAAIARIKILTNMKLDEKRKPQDGRFSARLRGRVIDFRVSTFPTSTGEKVEIRILDPEKGLRRVDAVGFSDDHLKMVRNAIARPYGLILITGPTGSGKSTTLYSMLNELDHEKYNIVTLEDPVEYSMAGVNQSSVRPEIEYSFANGLRSILRQDPDIIMVGEIRDAETAQLAIHAALTGHLVLSTLHTNNAVGVIPRLIDMGVEPFLIAPTLVLAIAQRLVRVICPDSKSQVPIDGSIKQMIDEQFADLPPQYRERIKMPGSVYRPVPSATCADGTKGRMAVFEMMEMDRELEELILKTPNESDIYRLARNKGMLTMKDDALLKSFQGIVPFEEVSNL